MWPERWNTGWSCTWRLFGWGSRGSERHERPSMPPIQSSRSQADLRAAATGRRWSPMVPCSCCHSLLWQPALAAEGTSVSLVDVACCPNIFRRRVSNEYVRRTKEWTADRIFYTVAYSQAVAASHCRVCWRCPQRRADSANTFNDIHREQRNQYGKLK